MADEYSDEEFAAVDGDGAAYEAEFDAEEGEEEEQHALQTATATEETEGDGAMQEEAEMATEEGGGRDTVGEEDDAYQESFDADGETEHEALATAAVAVAVADKAGEEEDQYDDAESYDHDAAEWRDEETAPPAEPPTAAAAKEAEEEPEEPISATAVELDAAQKPTPLAKPEFFITPVAVGSLTPSAGRARSSSLSQIADLPRIELCADPEMQAKLTRRSSSPRLRPAPVRRLASLGESDVATVEALLVPTNEVTEEAAAVVSAATAVDTSVSLVKRPSATFVPRLPSLLESSFPQVVDADPTVSGDTRASTPGSEEDEDEDDEKEDNDEVYGAGDGDADANGVEGEHKGRQEGEDAEKEAETLAQGERGDDDVLTSDVTVLEKLQVESVDADATTTAALDPDRHVDSSPLSSPEDADETQQVGEESNVGGERDDGEVKEANALEEATVHPPEVRGQGSELSPTEPVAQIEKLAGSPQDLMEQMMADVDYPDDSNPVDDDAVVEDDAAAYGGDDTEFVVDAEDGERRETRQLLHEAQMIITKQKENERAASPPDAIGYDDEDAFVDDDAGFEEDGDAEEDDGRRPSVVQYDSDYEELGMEDDDVDEAREKPVVISQPVASTNPSVSTQQTIQDEQQAVRQMQPTNEEVAVTTMSEGSGTPALNVETVAEETKPRAMNVTKEVAPPDQAKPSRSPSHTTKEMPSVSRTSTPVAARRSFRPVSMAAKPPESKPRSMSQGSPRKPVKPPVDQTPNPPPRKPEVPKFTPRAPVPRQSQPAAVIPATPPPPTSRKQPDDQSVGAMTPTRQSQSRPPVSPAKSNDAGTRPSSPVRVASQVPPKSAADLPRKAPVFKQKKAPKAASPDKNKKLKPVKCPPNLRIDIASHMDREKREWLLLNMFRHGDDVTKYEAFIPTSAAHQHMSAAIAGVDMAMSEAKRPLSARQIYGEPPAPQASRRTYSRHGGRKLVDRPVDPRLKERESSWVSIKSSESSIPAYDSILDKYCKTVTSPVVQRRIYETREYDLSPQLALVLEKRAFKEWKHGETESGFGSVTHSRLL